MIRKKRIAQAKRLRDARQAEAHREEEARAKRSQQKADRERKRRLAEWRKEQWQIECSKPGARMPESKLVAAPCTKPRTALHQY